MTHFSTNRLTWSQKKECKVIAATLHSSLVKRMAGFLSENFHILGKTILKFKFILGNELVFLTGTVISPQFKLKRINNSDFTEEEVVDVVKKELEHRYQTMSKIFSPIPIFLLHIYKFARLFVCQSAVYLLLLTKSYCLRMEVYSVSVNQWSPSPCEPIKLLHSIIKITLYRKLLAITNKIAFGINATSYYCWTIKWTSP